MKSSVVLIKVSVDHVSIVTFDEGCDYFGVDKRTKV